MYKICDFVDIAVVLAGTQANIDVRNPLSCKNVSFYSDRNFGSLPPLDEKKPTLHGLDVRRKLKPMLLHRLIAQFLIPTCDGSR